MKTLINKKTAVGAWLTTELSAVTSVIENHLKNRHRAVNDVCEELATYSGKMLRPSMVLLSWKTVSQEGATPESVRVAAAVVELIHLATLVHDDVLDDAELRRGKRTINSLHGNEAAVMLGDYLLSSAFHLCSTIQNKKLNLMLGEVTSTVCAGEIVQLFHRDNIDLDIDSYYQIIHDKTASLIAASCEMGAVLGNGSDSNIQTLKDFGNSVGTAFQIKDDLLDLLGEQIEIGKPAGRDLEKGKLTLPIITMLSDNPSLKPLAQEAIQNRDRETLCNMLEAAGSIQFSFDVVGQLVDCATQSLQEVFGNDTSDQLCRLAEQLKRVI